MRLISSSNKPLFVHLPTLPFGQPASGLKPHTGLSSSFRESPGPLPFPSQHSGPWSEIRRALFPSASHFFERFWHGSGAVAFKTRTTVHSKKYVLHNYAANKWCVSVNSKPKLQKTILTLSQRRKPCCFPVYSISFFKRCFLLPTKWISPPTDGLGPMV